jgi:hypothetical protein
MNSKIPEMALLAGIACVCLCLSWVYDKGMFETVFAVEAALAATGAVYLFL